MAAVVKVQVGIKINETCTRAVFAFEGIPVNSLEAVEEALKAKYGRACE